MAASNWFGEFRDWVKNLTYRRSMERENERKYEDLAAFDPTTVSDREITRLVDGLLRDRPGYFGHEKFKRLGRRAVPFLLRALGDPRFATTKSIPGWNEYTPVEEIVDLLQPFAPPESLFPLTRLVNHPDENVRSAAASGLGNLAVPEAIESWLALSRDAARGSAIRGVLHAAKDSRVHTEFLTAVFPRVAEILDETTDENVSITPAVELLLRLDRERALPILTDPKRFHPDNPKFKELLEGMDEVEVTLPADGVIPVLMGLNPIGGKYWAVECIGYLLKQLVRAHHPETLEWIANVRTWEASSSFDAKYLESYCSTALAMYHGITEPLNVIFNRMGENHDLNLLSNQQRAYYVVWLLDAEVCNGGFTQFLVNTSGDVSPHAVASFQLVGLPEHTDIVRQAMKLFGPSGPPADRDRRHEILASFPPKTDAELDRLASEYYAAPGNVATQLDNFAIADADHFRTPQSSENG